MRLALKYSNLRRNLDCYEHLSFTHHTHVCCAKTLLQIIDITFKLDAILVPHLHILRSMEIKNVLQGGGIIWPSAD
jgi:hypothetical protein